LETHCKIRLGVTSTYLVPGRNGYLLVDAGPMGKADLFFKRLEKSGVLPGQIKLIVLTHAHYDHAGCLSEIKKECRCPVMAHGFEAFFLKNPVFRLADPSLDHLPTVEEYQGFRVVQREKTYRFEAMDPEYPLDREVSLEDFGFSAKIVFTPGHTPGSLSVITRDQEAFIGDLALNTFPFGAGPCFPQYSFNHGQQIQSWEKIQRLGVKTVFPGHGRPFEADQFVPLKDAPKRIHLDT
jgi:hydroxyacylglutathione hydrolase